MDPYDAVQKGGLKFKTKGPSGVSTPGKKKKKKDKEKKKLEDVASIETETVVVTRPSKTKAELAFEKAKRDKDKQIILERASKSHKERIMEFNHQLDNLTEHFDIPKVSWTK